MNDGLLTRQTAKEGLGVAEIGLGHLLQGRQPTVANREALQRAFVNVRLLFV